MLQTKKGQTVVLIGFTGIRLSEVIASGATKTVITVTKKDGSDMLFDRKTGMQTNCVEGKEKYANKIMSIEDAPEAKAKAPKKAKGKKAPKVEAIPEDEFEDEDEEEAPAPAKKKAPAKVEEDDFEDDDEYEEV